MGVDSGSKPESTEYDDYVVGYAYHSKGPMANRNLCEYLRENQRIAIHYDNIPSLDSDDYTNGTGEINNINRFARKDGILAVSYSPLENGVMYVGEVTDDDPLILVIDDGEVIDEDRIKPEESRSPDYLGYDTDEYNFGKSLQLTNWMEVTQRDHRQLWESQSQGSIHRTTKKDDYLRRLIAGTEIPHDLSSLDGPQTELLAEKYLRDRYEDYQSDAVRGGRLQHVDILGSTTDMAIYAQVTKSETAEYVDERIQGIRGYVGPESEVFIFAPEDARPQELPKGIEFVALDKLFERFKEDPRKRHTLNVMLGRWTPN